MFQTEIIKLNSLKSSITSLFQNLSTKCQSSKDYDITVIVKESEQPPSDQLSEPPKLEIKKNNTVGFNDNPMIFNEDLSQSYISLNEKVEVREECKSNQSIEDQRIPKLGTKIRFKKKDDKENANPEPDLKVKTSNYAQTEEYLEIAPSQSQFLHSEIKIEDSGAGDSERYSFKINNVDVDTQNSDDDSEAGDGSDGGFLIENYLNQALEYIQKNRMEQLQDFLYKFKEKYNFTNLRAETKWSLLMGFCKESKLEFQRAATNYSQVIASISQNSMMISIQIADIYCRLGRCYFQIREWNRAISAYSQSLNIYKKNKKCLEYANCITNLGVLYLEIGYFIEAERCFLMAFNIKRSEGDKKDKKSQIPLLQTFCHLFDCNLKLKNLIQCEQILGNISSILDETEGSVDILHRLRYYIRSGKLLFFEGKLDLAENYYHHALNLLKKHNLSIQEHAQVLQLMGILKQELGDYDRSKFYYERAYHFLQKCVPIESLKLQTFKTKIELISELLARKRETKKCHKHTMIEQSRGLLGDKKKRHSTDKIMREKYENR